MSTPYIESREKLLKVLSEWRYLPKSADIKHLLTVDNSNVSLLPGICGEEILAGENPVYSWKVIRTVYIAALDEAVVNGTSKIEPNMYTNKLFYIVSTGAKYHSEMEVITQYEFMPSLEPNELLHLTIKAQETIDNFRSLYRI